MAREPARWYDLYGQPSEIAGRTRKFERKLAILGLEQALRPGPTLDVACGFGETLEFLYARGARDLVGTDLHDRPLAGAGTRYRYLRCACDALPFPDESFANVLCFHSLHHFDDIATVAGFLREAQRVLRPGGMLALIDHYDSWQLRLALRLILAGVFSWTAAMRSMREQLALEHDAMTGFFTDWPKIRALIDECGVERELFTRGLFFFYYRGRKPDRLAGR